MTAQNLSTQPAACLPSNTIGLKNRIFIALKTYPTLTLILLVVAVFLVIINFFLVKQASSSIAAVVNGEKIYQNELEDTKKIIRWSENITNEEDLKQASINHLVEKRLLAKEAKKQGLDQNQPIKDTLKQRIEAVSKDWGTKSNLISFLKISDPKNFDDYALNIVYRDYFKENVVWWKKVNFVSVRFGWEDPSTLTSKETVLKTVASEKIKRYYSDVKNGTKTLPEIIKERCQDSEINFRPFPDGRNVVLYTLNDPKFPKEFRGPDSCAEQANGIKITMENPYWNDKEFIDTLKKLKKGDVSEIFTLKTDNGLDFAYIFAEVIDGFDSYYLNFDEMYKSLKEGSEIKIYEN